LALNKGNEKKRKFMLNVGKHIDDYRCEMYNHLYDQVASLRSVEVNSQACDQLGYKEYFEIWKRIKNEVRIQMSRQLSSLRQNIKL
jgi:hypothetical protein